MDHHVFVNDKEEMSIISVKLNIQNMYEYTLNLDMNPDELI